MTRVICTVVVCGLVLTGCASQSPESESPEAEPSPAPVREASIVAVEEPQPLLVEDEPSVELAAQENIEQAPEIVIEDSPGLPEVAGSDLDVPSQPPAETALNSASAELAAEGVQAEPESGLTDVEGLVQLELPKDDVVAVAEDESAESDVATYLLDEAENSFQRQNYEKARGQSERALALEPTAGRAYLILARIELAEDRPDQAAEVARQGLASSGDSEEIFEQLNQILGQVAEMPSSAVLDNGSQEAVPETQPSQ